MNKYENKTLKKVTDKNFLIKIMCVMCTMAILFICTTVVAAAGNGTADGVKALYEYLIDITKVAGALMALFGILQIGVSISQTHDASQRMTGILLAAGGAMIFFATDIISIMGISV